MIHFLKEKVLAGGAISASEAQQLVNADLHTLCTYAHEIQTHFCGVQFDVCSIVNGRSGQCTENCRFCAQSSHVPPSINDYALRTSTYIVEDALHNQNQGVKRYSIVTSGRTLTTPQLRSLCETYRTLRVHSTLSLCASHGLLHYDQFVALKESGVTRYHNNLETSRAFFPQICTTHTYDDKLNALRDAKKAGLELCSGGIMGLGESFEDRISMAMELRSLEVSSIPINFLSPIKGTPMQAHVPLTLDEAQRIVALYRFLFPRAFIRLASGRALFQDGGLSLFQCGANATITGDMLTTEGMKMKEDIRRIEALGYKVVNPHE